MFSVPAQVHDVARALADPIRFEIYKAIAESPRPVTVKDLLARFPRHHSAIRLHLHRLEQAGLVHMEPIRKEGAVGRPELSFRPGRKDIRILLPPRNLELLARLALEYVLTASGEDTGAARLAEFGEQWGRRLVADRIQEADPAEALLAVTEVLSSLGCEARVEPHPTTRSPGGPYFRQADPPQVHALLETHCPFSPLSVAYHPAVCRVHQALVQGMLRQLTHDDGVTVGPETSLKARDDTCRIRVTFPPGRVL